MGDRLLQVRENAGLSQDEIVRALGLAHSKQAWSLWEGGKRKLPVEVAERVCQHFGVALDWLLTGRQPETPANGTPAAVAVEGRTYRGDPELAQMVGAIADALYCGSEPERAMIRGIVRTLEDVARAQRGEERRGPAPRRPVGVGRAPSAPPATPFSRGDAAPQSDRRGEAAGDESGS